MLNLLNVIRDRKIMNLKLMNRNDQNQRTERTKVKESEQKLRKVQDIKQLNTPSGLCIIEVPKRRK